MVNNQYLHKIEKGWITRAEVLEFLTKKIKVASEKLANQLDRDNVDYKAVIFDMAEINSLQGDLLAVYFYVAPEPLNDPLKELKRANDLADGKFFNEVQTIITNSLDEKRDNSDIDFDRIEDK